MKRVRPLGLHRHERGFSVVEALLAATVFGVLVAGLIGAIVYGRLSNANAGDRARANYLAEEGIEAVRNIGAASFSNLVDSTATNVGDTTVETGSDSNVSGTSAYKVTTGASTSGAVTSLSAYVKTVDGTGNQLVQMAVYADSSGAPGARLGASAIQTVSTTGWNVFPISGVTVAANTSYWIGLSENGNTIFASTTTGGNAAYRVTTGYPAPDPFAANDPATTDKLSFYMTVGTTYGLAQSGGIWTFSGLSDTNDIYTRTVTVATAGTNRKTIASTVRWAQPNGTTATTTAMAQLTNWRAALAPTTSWANAIVAGTATPSGSLTGIKVATAGNYAYVVLSGTTNNFIIVDISNPAAPSIVSTTSLLVTPTNIAVSGNYAYITSTTGTGGLKIYNVSTPSAPTLASTLNFTGTASCNGVYVNGNYAYVVRTLSTTTGSNEFNVVNVTTPTSPSVVGSYNNNANTMNEVWASGNYAYVAQTGTSTVAEMAIINVTTPASPTLTTSYNPAGTNTALTIGGIGNTVFLGYGTTLNSVNVTTPASPASLGSFTAASTIRDLDEDTTNQIIFMGTASTTGEFQVVNVAAPASMSLIKTLDISGTSALTGVAYNSTLDVVASSSAATTLELRVMTKS